MKGRQMIITLICVQVINSFLCFAVCVTDECSETFFGIYNNYLNSSIT